MASKKTWFVGFVLLGLFKRHGRPLVVKYDNGIDSVYLRCLLLTLGVFPLVSPPYTPTYNGGVESGIGILKRLCEQQSLYEWTLGLWSDALLEGARVRHNTESFHPDFKKKTREEVWSARTPLNEIERSVFMNDVVRYREEGLAEKKLLPEALGDRKIANSLDRVAMRRALVKHGHVTIEKRTIHPRITTRRAARNA